MTYAFKQGFDNSCGAAALMVAACELGVDRLPRAANMAPLIDDYTPITDTQTRQDVLDGLQGQPNVYQGNQLLNPALEKYIYAITSGDMKSYSVPSRIVACARLLGLSSTLYAEAGFYKKVLNWWYEDEESRVEAQSTATVVHGASPGPAGNQRELVVMSTWAVGLHYVMHRPQPPHYMDPGDGTNHQTYDDLNTWAKNYSPTGISIVLEKI